MRNIFLLCREKTETMRVRGAAVTRLTIRAVVCPLYWWKVAGCEIEGAARCAAHVASLSSSSSAPGDAGLPSRIAYAGRHYSSAGDCWSSSRLQREGAWPLHAVSQLPTLLGPAHPVLSAPVPQGMTSMLLLVPAGACYTAYSLEGGP
jgi:hypothetical protein